MNNQLKDVEQLLEQYAQQLENIQAPTYLTDTINEIFTTYQPKKSKKHWLPLVAGLLLLLAITPALYHQYSRLLISETVVSDSIKTVMTADNGIQPINSQYTLENGDKVYVDGVTANNNDLVVLWRLEPKIQTSPQPTANVNLMLDENNNDAVVAGNFNPNSNEWDMFSHTSLNSRKLPDQATLAVQSQEGNEYVIPLELNPKEVGAYAVEVKLDQSLDINHTTITMQSIIADNLTTTINFAVEYPHFTAPQDAQLNLDAIKNNNLSLCVDNKNIALLSQECTLGATADTYNWTVTYKPLPRSFENVCLKINSIGVVADQPIRLPATKDSIISSGGFNAIVKSAAITNNQLKIILQSNGLISPTGLILNNNQIIQGTLAATINAQDLQNFQDLFANIELPTTTSDKDASTNNNDGLYLQLFTFPLSTTLANNAYLEIGQRFYGKNTDINVAVK